MTILISAQRSPGGNHSQLWWAEVLFSWDCSHWGEHIFSCGYCVYIVMPWSSTLQCILHHELGNIKGFLCKLHIQLFYLREFLSQPAITNWYTDICCDHNSIMYLACFCSWFSLVNEVLMQRCVSKETCRMNEEKDVEET